jgi:hypothetical protein
MVGRLSATRLPGFHQLCLQDGVLIREAEALTPLLKQVDDFFDDFGREFWEQHQRSREEEFIHVYFAGNTKMLFDQFLMRAASAGAIPPQIEPAESEL